MTHARIAAIEKEFEAKHPKPAFWNNGGMVGWSYDEWCAACEGWIAAHTSSEMSKDAELYRALLDSGKYAPDRSGYWALQCGPRYEYPKAEMDAAINHAIKEQSNGTS